MAAISLDTEMVGVGQSGEAVARVSLVDENLYCIYDTYVKCDKLVSDYRTQVSGVTAEKLAHGKSLELVKSEVSQYIKGRILVGHTVSRDLEVLGLSHPEKSVRDLARYPPYLQNGQPTALKSLASKYLSRNIQTGQHDSKEDADVAMQLYKRVKADWNRMF